MKGTLTRHCTQSSQSTFDCNEIFKMNSANTDGAPSQSIAGSPNIL